MTDFLLELRSEEIPARMQVKAKADLERLFVEALAKGGLKAEAIETFATPRRLALIAHGLPLATEAVSEETKGPKVGAPPQALDGFTRKLGLTVDQLTARDGVYFAVVEKPGRAAADVLAEAIPSIVRAFPWPKSMRWGTASLSTESLRWVRPLQGIIALLGGDVVACEVDGITSGRETMGHRFHSTGPVRIADPSAYVEALCAAHVIVHFSERCRIIRDGATKAAADCGLVIVEDEALVIENAGLTEWPVPLLGRFDPAFLDVPPEVIQLTARVNQKYFVCHDARGALTNAFICTANIDAHDGGAAIIAGNEKVLAARLADAKFFWEADLKVPLDAQAEKLSQIVFHEKLGTVADKVERVAKLAEWLVTEGIVKGCEPADARRAAELCKADLVTGMVGEFPELQGIMGGHLARAQGEHPAVADAIRDHYKPVGQGDDVPTAPVTVAVSLADKLDTLVGFFRVGERPTGSKDPFALRRAAIGVCTLILSNQLKLNLADVLSDDARQFVVERHKVLMQQSGFRHDHIDAVRQFGAFYLLDDQKKVSDLSQFLAGESAKALVGGLKRVYNILSDAERREPKRHSYFPVEGSKLVEPEEKRLFEKHGEIVKPIKEAIAENRYSDALTLIAGLRPFIDDFFDKVTVNVGDGLLRENRLALLAWIQLGSLTVADFSKIEG